MTHLIDYLTALESEGDMSPDSHCVVRCLIASFAIQMVKWNSCVPRINEAVQSYAPKADFARATPTSRPPPSVTLRIRTVGGSASAFGVGFNWAHEPSWLRPGIRRGWHSNYDRSVNRRLLAKSFKLKLLCFKQFIVLFCLRKWFRLKMVG